MTISFVQLRGLGARANQSSQQGRSSKQDGGEEEGAPPASSVNQYAPGESTASDGQLDQRHLQSAGGFKLVGGGLGHPGVSCHRIGAVKNPDKEDEEVWSQSYRQTRDNEYSRIEQDDQSSI
jgi:hypothetical protein